MGFFFRSKGETPMEGMLKWLGIPTRKERQMEKLKQVQWNSELFQKICIALRDGAPHHGRYIVLRAAMPLDMESPDSQYAQVECYETQMLDVDVETWKKVPVSKERSQKEWFRLSENSEHNVLLWLLEQREHIVKQDQPKWKGILFVVDVPGDRFWANLIYN